MTDTFYNLAGRIDGETVSLLSETDRVARDSDIAFFIVGAAARDILMQHAYGIHTARATLDIDIGVFVSGWNQFLTLKDALIRTGNFSPAKQVHRLRFRDELLMDIIPFGGIAGKKGSVLWPPEYDIEMSILGFRECYQHAVSVLVGSEPDLIVKVVSPAGLAILKLISWNESVERRNKDAADLFFIMRNYIDAGNTDRFIDEEYGIFKEEESDYDRSSARFLGREMSGMARHKTKARLIGILEKEAASPEGHKIVMDIFNADKLQKQSYGHILSCFDALLRGLSD